MSDIRFNQWLHNSGTGGISQDSAGHVGIGTTVPTHINALTNNNSILHVGIVSCNTLNAASKIEGSIDDWIIHQDDTNTKFGFPAADQFQVYVAGAPKITATSTEITAAVQVNIESAGSYIKSNQLKFNPNGDAFIDHGVTSKDITFRLSNSSALDFNAIKIDSSAQQTKFGKQIVVGLQGGNDVTTIGGGSGIGAYIQLEHASSGINTKLMGNNDSYLNQFHGNLAIGEDNPDGNKLLIRAASTVGTNRGHIMLTGDSATNGQGPQIVFSESGSGSQYAGAYVGHIREGSNSTGSLVFGTRGTGGDGSTVPDERIRIYSTGQILYSAASGDNQITSKRTNSAGSNGNYFFHLKAQASGGTDVGALGFHRDTNTDDSRLVFFTRNTGGSLQERLRIASTGSSYFGLPSISNFQPEAQVSIISHKDMNSDKDDASKFHLVLKNPNNDTGEAVGLGFAITDTASKIGAVIAHKRTAAGSTGELSFYVRSANGSAPTRRLRIGPEGGVTIGSIDNGYANSLLVQAGIYISAYNGDNLITNGSQGGGASTLYIGNQAIQMSSDKRIKKNIVDTTTNVLDKIKQVRVVDFDWDDPSDTASVNRNSRGKWTGCLAQEMVDIFPHVINAPRKGDNSLDYDSDRTWLVDYGHLVPTLIKGMQEQQKQIEELKAEVAAFESS